MIALAVLQMIIGQVAAWQSFGLTLSKGAGQIEGQAETRASTMTALKNARAELAQIGIVRPVAAIRADEVLECEKKSSQFKDGVGPKCTKLRGEMATAERARKLEADVAALTTQLAGGPAVTNANAIYEIPQALMQGVANAFTSTFTDGRKVAVGPDDVRFLWLIVLAFALEFFGTFGLALIRNGGGSDDGRADAKWASEARTKNHPDALKKESTPYRDVMADMLGALPLAAPQSMFALASPAGASDAHFASAPGASHEGGRAYNSPINIHFAAPHAAAHPPWAGPTNGGTAGVNQPSPDLFLAPSDAHFASGAGAASAPGAKKSERRDIEALPADAPPVDRSRIARPLSPEEREAADVILSFRAACIVDTPGGIVVASDIWKRYRRWAGERALGEAPFLSLLADVADIHAVDIGGHLHVRGVALRAGASMEVAA